MKIKLEVYNIKTKEVVREMVIDGEHRAYKVYSGLCQKVNFELFDVRWTELGDWRD